MDRPTHAQRDRGQAAVELALAVPVLLVFLLFVVQVGLVMAGALAVQHAARDLARRASVAANADAAPPTEPSTLRLSGVVTSSGNEVTAVVTGRVPTDVPLVGALLPDIVVTRTVTMPREPP